MDVLVLIDKLDDLIHNARSVPLTDSVMIDREEIYDLLDQMRSTIPEEIKQARWIVKERQEMLAEAQERAEKLANDTEVVRLAEKNAQQIMEDARDQERQIRLGAEDYADEVLSNLEMNLDKFLAAVRRGRERLQGREEEAQI
jgi:cell division septum initiation protein DivIVA